MGLFWPIRLWLQSPGGIGYRNGSERMSRQSGYRFAELDMRHLKKPEP
jgi:hypothetical protein